jgi:hypothetical protein
MLNRVRLLLVLFSGVGLILAACNVQSALSPSTNTDVFATYEAFDRLPAGEEEALAQGWIDTGECVPQMGRHFIKMAGEQPGPLVLLFNPAGDLIGVELESLSEQPAPPWEHLEQGHPGMEFEHWTIHFWFSDPADACTA